jgi:DNA invertase Pin-like site-specific DNA recombinase
MLANSKFFSGRRCWRRVRDERDSLERPSGRFVAYYRVSTDKQGKSGLGLEAQREVINTRLNGGLWQLIGEFTEIESGRRAKRPQLGAALTACKKHKAKLVVAKLDRLSRASSPRSRAVDGRSALSLPPL